MKLKFPKIVEAFDLAEYHESFAGQKIYVWLNPPADHLASLGDKYKAHNDKTGIPAQIKLVEQHLKELEEPTDEQVKEHKDMLKFYKERLKEVNGKEYENCYEEYLALLSELLSQNADKDTHVSVEDLHDIEAATKEANPRFWVWFQNRVITAINDHRTGQKKG